MRSPNNRSSFSKTIKELSSRKLRTHTPAHAGNNLYLPRSLSSAFKFDFSEITELDDLHNPTEIILRSQEKAAELFQVEQTFFSVNGASACLMASCLAIGQGGKVLIPRNAHKSLISGLILSGAEPIWYELDWDEDWGVYKNINLNSISDSLKKHSDIRGIFVTSPTYEGIQFQLGELIEMSHEKEIPVIADESHGGHISLLKNGQGAINDCADLIIHSPHKTLGSLTQTGLLHCQSDLINKDKVFNSLSLLQTTSPSWLLLASLVETIEHLSTNLKPLQQQWSLAQQFRQNASRLTKLQFLQNNDPTRCVLSLKGWRGEELSEWLHDNYKIETELEGHKWVMFLMGIGLMNHHSRQLLRALEKATELKENFLFEPERLARPTMMIGKDSPRKAFFESNEAKIEFECPPGIPTKIPGQINLRKNDEINFRPEKNLYFEEDFGDYEDEFAMGKLEELIEN